MDEFQLVNDAKEALCYVALDFKTDVARLRQRRSGLRREFVLPDFHTTMRGYAKQDDQPNKESEGKQGAGAAEQQVGWVGR